MVCAVACCSVIGTFELICGPRPVKEDGQRVPPSELRNHRNTHKFLGPSCLCALKDAEQPAFTEAAIYIAVTQDMAGEYVASCAKDRCGYHGKSMSKPEGIYAYIYPKSSLSVFSTESVFQ